MSDTTLHNFEVFPWNKNFETGHPEIDEQHKKLVELLNNLANTLVNEEEIEVSRAFKELADYADYHFSEEESIWSKYLKSDHLLESHQLTHASFLPKVLEIKERDQHKPLLIVVENIVKFLIRWLAFHIIDDDKRLSIIIHEMNDGKSLHEAKVTADEKMSGTIKILIETVLSMYDGLSARTLNLLRERNARIKAEDSLREANRKLEEFNTHLQEMVDIEVAKHKEQQQLLINQSKMADMGQMLSAIIHQWKQPLNVISLKAGNIGLINEDSEHPNPKLDEIEEDIAQQIKFMNQTINDFRSFFKPSKMKNIFSPEASIRKLLGMFYSVYSKHSITINIHKNEKFEVLGYENEFIQVILNLFNNSKDAFVERGVDDGVIECYFEVENDIGIIKIEDCAGGIDESLLPDKLFDRHITTKGEDGSGIGLNISKSIIERYENGSMMAENIEGGARFVIKLPIHKEV